LCEELVILFLVSLKTIIVNLVILLLLINGRLVALRDFQVIRTAVSVVSQTVVGHAIGQIPWLNETDCRILMFCLPETTRNIDTLPSISLLLLRAASFAIAFARNRVSLEVKYGHNRRVSEKSVHDSRYY